MQLMLIAALPIIFAAAIGGVDEKEQKTQTLMARRIACCLAGTAGLLGLLKVVGEMLLTQGNSQVRFPPASATVEASVGMQFMLIAALLMVFAAAIGSSDEKEQKTSSESADEKKQRTPIRTADEK